MEPNILNFTYNCSVTQWTPELLLSGAQENPTASTDLSVDVLPLSTIESVEDMTMPDCQFREADGQCNIITELADTYYPSPEECRGCSRCPKPCAVNEVTLSIGNRLRVEDGKPELSSPGKGPGSRLANLLSWFKTDSCGCQERADIMDAWGVEGCKENMPTILYWLRSSAAAQNLPYSETGMKIILHSIFLVEQKLCTNQSSKQS